MAYQFKITRLERIKENNVLKFLVIGITCENTDKKQSAYIDWKADIKDVGKTKTELLNYIKNYLTEAINQDEIDRATEDKKIDETIIIPAPIKRFEQLKIQTNRPVITTEQDTLLSKTDKDLIF